MPSDSEARAKLCWSATAVAYDVTPNWTAALNVNNLFDKVYYEYPGYVENRNNYGAPRSVLLTLRGRF
nr:TonB-dependent receptor [Mesopusillimonas faecipullorum]